MPHLRKLLFLFSFSLILSQCGLFETKPYQPQKSQTIPDLPPAKPIDQPEVIHSTTSISCDEFLQSNGLSYKNSIWLLKSKTKLSQTDFIKWLDQNLPDLFDSKACSGEQQYSIQYQSESDTFEILVKAENYALLKNQKISSAEFYRRLNLKVIQAQQNFDQLLNQALQKKDYKKALELVKKEQNKLPDLTDLKRLEAKLLIRLDQNLEALTLLDSFEDETGIKDYLKAYANQNLGRFQEAIELIKPNIEVIQLSAEYAGMGILKDDLKIMLIELYLKNNQPDLAEPLFGRLSEPSRPAAILLKGIQLRLNKSYQKAYDHFQSWSPSREINIKYKHFYLTLLSVDLRDQNKALEAYQTLKDVAPRWAKDFEFLEKATLLPLEDVEVIGWILSIPLAHAQAIPPTEQVQASEKTNVNVSDLPYQPKELDEISKDLQNLDLKNDSSDTTESKKIEWDQIPYIPSKFPELDLGIIEWNPTN